MNKSMAIGFICLVVAVLSISLSEGVSAQSPCDNVTKYLEDNGIIEQPYDVWNVGGPIHIVNESFYVTKLVVNKSEKVYFVGCVSEKIFDHKPSTEELLGVSVPEKIDEPLFIKMKTGPTDTEYVLVIITKEYLTQLQIDQLNQTILKLNAVVPLIFSNVTLDQFDAISNFNWVRLPLNRRAEFEESDKITVTIQSNPEFFTEERYNQVIRTGAEIFLADRDSIVQYIYVIATQPQIEEIADFDWVFIIREGGGVYEGMPDKESKSAYYSGIFILVLALFLFWRWKNK